VPHRNARTTFHGRLLIVARYRAGWPKAHIAAAMGISRKCVATWLDRFAVEGEAGLHDRSSRPHSTPRRTSAEVEAQILVLRDRLRSGPDGISAELHVPARTVSRVLAPDPGSPTRRSAGSSATLGLVIARAGGTVG
jgi:hypothetical protein